MIFYHEPRNVMENMEVMGNGGCNNMIITFNLKEVVIFSITRESLFKTQFKNNISTRNMWELSNKVSKPKSKIMFNTSKLTENLGKHGAISNYENTNNITIVFVRLFPSQYSLRCRHGD